MDYKHIKKTSIFLLSFLILQFQGTVFAATKKENNKYEKKVILVLETGRSIVDNFFYRYLEDIGRFHYERVDAHGMSSRDVANWIAQKKQLSKADSQRIFDEIYRTNQKFQEEYKHLGPSSESDKDFKNGGARFEENKLNNIPNLAYILHPRFVIGRPRSVSAFKVEKKENRTSVSFSATVPVVAEINIYKMAGKDQNKLVKSLVSNQNVPFGMSKSFDNSEANTYLAYMHGVYNQLKAGSVGFLYLSTAEQRDLIQVKSPNILGEDIKTALIAGRNPKATAQWKQILKELKIKREFKDNTYITDYLPTDLAVAVSLAALDGYDFDDPNIARILMAAAKEKSPFASPLAKEDQLLWVAQRRVELKGAHSAAGEFLDAMTATDIWNIGLFRWLERDIRSVPGFKITAEITNYSPGKGNMTFGTGMEVGLDRDTWLKTETDEKDESKRQATGYYKVRRVLYKNSAAQQISFFGEPEKQDGLVEIPTIPYNLSLGSSLPFRFGGSEKPGDFSAYLQGAYDLTSFLDRVSGRKTEGGLSDYLNEIYTTQTFSYERGTPDQIMFQIGLMKKHYITSFAPYYGILFGPIIRKIPSSKDENAISHLNLSVDAGLQWMFWFEPFMFLNLGVNVGSNFAISKGFETFFNVSPHLTLGLEF